MSYSNSGTVTYTADSVIGVSGKPVRIYSIYWVKGAGTEALVIRHGTAATDTVLISHASTASTGNFLDLGSEGILFPSGAFFDIATALTTATITFRSET